MSLLVGGAFLPAEPKLLEIAWNGYIQSKKFPCLVAEGGGGSAKFSGIIIFSMELYYGDQLCSKCMTKSFVSYPVNNIEAHKNNVQMTLQSAIASTVTVIVGILVCIVVRLPIGLPPAPWSCVLYFCICEYFEKLRKLVTLRRYSDKRNLGVDL